jgi:hypothetical protein
MEGHGRLFERLATFGRTHLGEGHRTALAMQIRLGIFLQHQLGCPLDQVFSEANQESQRQRVTWLN